jgi:hypothetical protein
VGVLEVKRVARSEELVELVEVEEAEVEASAEVDETEGPPTEGWCELWSEFSEAGREEGRG